MPPFSPSLSSLKPTVTAMKRFPLRRTTSPTETEGSMRGWKSFWPQWKILSRISSSDFPLISRSGTSTSRMAPSAKAAISTSNLDIFPFLLIRVRFDRFPKHAEDAVFGSSFRKDILGKRADFRLVLKNFVPRLFDWEIIPGKLLIQKLKGSGQKSGRGVRNEIDNEFRRESGLGQFLSP